MKRILGCFIFFMIMMTSQIFAGNDYYVDATNGNDLNVGLSPATAWKTISKINNSVFKEQSNFRAFNNFIFSYH